MDFPLPSHLLLLYPNVIIRIRLETERIRLVVALPLYFIRIYTCIDMAKVYQGINLRRD